MQTRRTIGAARSVIAMAVWISLVGVAQAQNETKLSAEDELAYKQAYASWRHITEVNENVGLPPMGSRPQREDFAGYTKAQPDAVAAQKTARAEAEERWQRRLEEHKPYIRELVPTGRKKPNDRRSQTISEEQERLRMFSDKAWANRPVAKAMLEAIARKHGVSVVRKKEDGEFEQLAGEFGGYPAWITSHNQIAAAGVSGDELWPTNSAPWPSSSTGRNLTGSNVVIGAWEVGGQVNTNHTEFGGRVLQMDDDSTNISDHATGVVGTMAAHGESINLPSIPTGSVARGVAFGAYVDAYDTWNFDSELADASVDRTNALGLRISNHSWGIGPIWAIKYIDTYWYGGTEYDHYSWGTVWQQNPALYEDPYCGLYLWDTPDGYGSAELDGFLSTNAPRHLLLYSAGNDRFHGPGQPVYYFYEYGGEWHLVNNPPANDKDWSIGDGDTYGFDTVKPPGTSKNVLTVGSVLDVHHDEGGNLRWGYASNSTVTVSDFSGCGPTDDGRIKPDVMAVGQADSAVRSYGIVTPNASGGYTTNYSGTSFAAPVVSGGLALSLQRRNQLFSWLDPSLDAWLSSTLKILAIHTADDILNPGPDYLSGWGLFNAASAVAQVELDAQDGRGTHLKEFALAAGATNSWLVDLDGSQFKATIGWNDPPGVPPAYADDSTPMLVNDLDLWIETEDGTQIFRPFVLNPDLTNESETVRNVSATTGIDDRNNVEQVLIENPTSGLYRICVAHTGGTAGGQTPTTQWVSVATSGDTTLPPKITEFVRSPSTNQFLLTFECDPGAHLILETSTNLLNSAGWMQEGTLTTESWTNSILSTESGNIRFWRLRRETGN
jgi:hypothetical protein